MTLYTVFYLRQLPSTFVKAVADPPRTVPQVDVSRSRSRSTSNNNSSKPSSSSVPPPGWGGTPSIPSPSPRSDQSESVNYDHRVQALFLPSGTNIYETDESWNTMCNWFFFSFSFFFEYNVFFFHLVFFFWEEVFVPKKSNFLCVILNFVSIHYNFHTFFFLFSKFSVHIQQKDFLLVGEGRAFSTHG